MDLFTFTFCKQQHVQILKQELGDTNQSVQLVLNAINYCFSVYSYRKKTAYDVKCLTGEVQEKCKTNVLHPE